MTDSASRFQFHNIRLTPVEKAGEFDNSLTDEKVFPYAVELTEGISEPFCLKLTVLSGRQFSASALKATLKRKYTLELVQLNENHQTLRERQLEGIVTSYRMTGRVVSNQLGLDDCYSYEFTLEPELVLMGLMKKTRSWNSCSVSEIIGAIFEEYSMNVVFDKELMAGDMLSIKSFIFEQFEESDLEFIQKLCVRFSLNITYGYLDDQRKLSATIFSRGAQLYRQYPVMVKNSQISPKNSIKASLNKDIQLIDGHYTVHDCLYCVSGMQDSIYEDRSAVCGLDGFSSDLNDDISANEKQKNYLQESEECVKRFSEECVLSYASDLVYVPGCNIDFDCGQLGIPDTTYIIARSYLNFTTDYPKGLASDDELISKESVVEQCFVSIKSNTDGSSDVLGPVSKFNINDFSIQEKKLLTAGNGRYSSGKEGANSDFRIVSGIVCDKDGNISGEDESLRIPSFSNRGLYNCFYVKIKNALTPVICTNVVKIGSDTSGSIPLLGQSVSMIFNGNCYYLNGILPNSQTIGVNDQKYDEYRSKSLVLVQEKTNDGVYITPSCSLETKIKDLLIRNELNTLIDNLDASYDTGAVSSFYRNCKLQMSYKVISSGSNGLGYSQTEKTQLKSYFEWSCFIPSLLSENKEYLSSISERIKTKELSGEVKEQDLDDLDTAKSVLADTYKLIDSYAKSLGSELEDSLDDSQFETKGSITAKSSTISLNSKSDDEDITSSLTISGNSGITLKAFNSSYNALQKVKDSEENSSADDSDTEEPSTADQDNSSPSTTDSGSQSDSSEDKTGKISLEASDEITIKSAKKIKLSVANNSIVIDQSGISITANMFPVKNTAFSSSIKLNTLGSLTAKGTDVKLSGAYSAALEDGYAGKVAICTGLASIRGATVSLSSTDFSSVASSVASLTKRVADFANMIAKVIEKSTSKDDKLETLQTNTDLGTEYLDEAVDIVEELFEIAQNFRSIQLKKDTSSKVAHGVKCYIAVTKILSLIEEIVNTTFELVDGEDNTKYTCRSDIEKLGTRDIVEIVLSSLTKIGYLLQAVIALRVLLKRKVSSMSIECDKIQASTNADICFYGKKIEDATAARNIVLQAP
ncbi:MAG: contractile injection system protein, VgrG/Pvc8 family [Succinivibrio sp.]